MGDEVVPSAGYFRLWKIGKWSSMSLFKKNELVFKKSSFFSWMIHTKIASSGHTGWSGLLLWMVECPPAWVSNEAEIFYKICEGDRWCVAKIFIELNKSRIFPLERGSKEGKRQNDQKKAATRNGRSNHLINIRLILIYLSQLQNLRKEDSDGFRLIFSWNLFTFFTENKKGLRRLFKYSPIVKGSKFEETAPKESSRLSQIATKFTGQDFAIDERIPAWHLIASKSRKLWRDDLSCTNWLNLRKTTRTFKLHWSDRKENSYL